MKNIFIAFGLFLAIGIGITSCEETNKQDNTTQSVDTMVIKENTTDNPTNTVSTDTTRR